MCTIHYDITIPLSYFPGILYFSVYIYIPTYTIWSNLGFPDHIPVTFTIHRLTVINKFLLHESHESEIIEHQLQLGIRSWS